MTRREGNVARRALLISLSLAAALLAAAAGGRPCLAQGAPPPDSSAAVAPASRPDTSRGVGLKDPKLALLLSVYPGMGQHYAGEHRRAVLIAAGTGVPMLIGILHDFAVGMKGFGCILSPDCEFASDAEMRRARRERNALLAVGGAVWAYGAWDAPRAARRANERRVNGRAPRVSLAAGVTPGGALYAGVAIPLR